MSRSRPTRTSHRRRTVRPWRLSAALAALAVLVAACGGGGPPPPPDAHDVLMFISNYSDARIEVMSAESDPAELAANPGLRIADPAFVSVISAVWGPGDRLYVSDFALNQIRVYDADDAMGAAAPTPVAIITSPDLVEAYAMAFDPSGNLWVSDRRGSRDASPITNRIVKFTAASVAAATGATSLNAATVITFDTSTPAFAYNRITSLTFDEQGDLWFTDVLAWAVYRTTDPGSLTGTVNGHVPTLRLQSINFGTPELSDIRNPTSLAVDSDGNLYVGNRGRDKVARFDGAASLTGDYAGATRSADAMLAVGLTNASLVTIAPDGALWVGSSGPTDLSQLVRVTGQAGGSGNVALTPIAQFGWAPGNTNAYNEAGGMTFHIR